MIVTAKLVSGIAGNTLLVFSFQKLALLYDILIYISIETIVDNTYLGY